MKSFQVFRNDSPEANPNHNEGFGKWTFAGIAKCPAVAGPVDARSIKGLGKNYDTVHEFHAACNAAGLVAKETDAEYNDDGEEIRDGEETKPATGGKKGGGKKGKS